MSSTASGTDTTSISTAVNRPASSSGSPASSQAIASSAGSTDSRPSSRPAVPGDGLVASPAAGLPATMADRPRGSVSASALIPPPAGRHCGASRGTRPWNPVNDHAACRGTVQAHPAEDLHPGRCPGPLDEYGPHPGPMNVGTEPPLPGRGWVPEPCD